MKFQFSITAILSVIFLAACWAGALSVPSPFTASVAKIAQIIVVALAVSHVVVNGRRRCSPFTLAFAVTSVVFSIVDANALSLPYDVPNHIFEYMHGEMSRKEVEVRHFRSGFKSVFQVLTSGIIALSFRYTFLANRRPEPTNKLDDHDCESG